MRFFIETVVLGYNEDVWGMGMLGVELLVILFSNHFEYQNIIHSAKSSLK
jgi:hypothetical protein